MPTLNEMIDFCEYFASYDCFSNEQFARREMFYAISDELQKKQRPYGKWIPCSERVPKEHGYYIVQTDGSHGNVVDIAEFGKYGNLIWGWNKASRVIAWMPLPEPYREEGDNK